MTPARFEEDFDQFIAALILVHEAMKHDRVDIVQARYLVDDFHELQARWNDRVGKAAQRRLTEVGRAMEFVRRRLELVFRRQLCGVLNARAKWGTAELEIERLKAFIGFVKTAPEPLHSQLLADFRKDNNGCEFDPVAVFREAVKGGDEAEHDFRKALTCLDIDWPGRVDSALRQRLHEADADALSAWIKDLTSGLAALTNDLSELADLPDAAH